MEATRYGDTTRLRPAFGKGHREPASSPRLWTRKSLKGLGGRKSTRATSRAIRSRSSRSFGGIGTSPEGRQRPEQLRERLAPFVLAVLLLERTVQREAGVPGARKGQVPGEAQHSVERRAVVGLEGEYPDLGVEDSALASGTCTSTTEPSR